MKDFIVQFRDEAHLLAHVDHFLVHLETALVWARQELACLPDRTGWAHFDFICPEPEFDKHGNPSLP